MNELEDDIRSTSEDVIADAERLLDIERRKVRLDPHDPERMTLAMEAEDLGDQIATKAEIEYSLVKEDAANESAN